MGQPDTGAHFEILLDGKTRSYRDDKRVAIEAAQYLKDRYRQNEVKVRDVRDKSEVVIVWENGVAFVRVSVISLFDGCSCALFDGRMGCGSAPDATERAAVLAAVKDATRRWRGGPKTGHP